MPPKLCLDELPPEVILERVLPNLQDKDLLALGTTSKRFHELCNDESLWLHRTRETFTYNPHTLAPPHAGSGWSKRLYIGLSRPEPFVWGCGDNDRLGLPERRGPGGGRIVTYTRSVQRPASLAGQVGGEGRRWVDRLGDDLRESITGGDLAGPHNGAVNPGVIKSEVGVVEIQAGGWSFAARDMNGGVWVWGQLDGQMPVFRSEGWVNKHERVPEPTLIPLPCKAEAISVGRSHMLVLDEDNLIWEMREWGKAYHHTASSLTSPINRGASGRPHHIIQLSAGWSHSACLTSSGSIHVWFPFSQAYVAALTPAESMNGPIGVRDDGDESRAVHWGSVGGSVVLQLEGLPIRSDWLSGGGLRLREADCEAIEGKEREWTEYEATLGEKERLEGEKIVKIASGQDFVVALKANGEVWLRFVDDTRQYDWEYLPFFSSPRISHITAQFTSLTSYSTIPPSQINHARLPEIRTPGFGNHFRPDDLPSLQGKDVIQVAIGDYHSAALTSRGEMWTWGQGDNGQLGLGETGMRGQRVVEPKRVLFPKDMVRDDAGIAEREEGAFVFAITAAGWHTGALVLGSIKRDPAVSRTEETDTKQGMTVTSPIPAGSATSGRAREPFEMPGAFPTSLDILGPSTSSTRHQGGPRPGGALPFFRIGFPGRQMVGDLEEPMAVEPQIQESGGSSGPQPQLQGLDLLSGEIDENVESPDARGGPSSDDRASLSRRSEEIRAEVVNLVANPTRAFRMRNDRNETGTGQDDQTRPVEELSMPEGGLASGGVQSNKMDLGGSSLPTPRHPEI